MEQPDYDIINIVQQPNYFSTNIKLKKLKKKIIYY
jgi:hypothetical protein